MTDVGRQSGAVPAAMLGSPVALRRIDPAKSMARFYAVSVQPTLFGDWAVVRRWGRINTEGRRRETWHASRAPAEAQAAAQIASKRRRGYRDT